MYQRTEMSGFFYWSPNQGACVTLAVVVLSLDGILAPVVNASLAGTWAP